MKKIITILFIFSFSIFSALAYDIDSENNIKLNQEEEKLIQELLEILKKNYGDNFEIYN